MSRKVTFVELTLFSGVVPLASGYMEVCCRKDPVLDRSFLFEKASFTVETEYGQILSTLKNSDADVYAFSCYVWNSGLVRRLLAALLEAKRQSHFMLGGPQVMNQGARYLSPEYENVFICNGEGERTFPNFLRELLRSQPDLSTVRNLSFYRNRQLLTTEPEPRITDLSEIPSPFLEGVFEKNKYSYMLIESNRGCPFKCNYCYWGSGATGVKVYKYDEDRLKQELAWISQSQCWYLFIVDANWGMLKRDVDISQFIVECHKRYGSPLSVYFCGSKNTPDRVTEIMRIFHGAGMISSQSVALQTMNPETLTRVNRDNIKTSAYTQIQQSLNQHGIPSFVEMIWPLPGETLSSFQEGLAKLCDIGANSFIVYPLLLMNNVELAEKRQEYGLVTMPDPNPHSEAEIVVQTSEVSAEVYREGQHYVYSMLLLHVLRGLWHLGRYLNAHGILSYAQLFRSFVEFYRQRTTHPLTIFCEDSIRKLENTTFSNTGALVHLVLYSHRESFDKLLEQFAQAQDFWCDPLARFFFEVDLIHRPYIYKNTLIIAKQYLFEHLRVSSVTADGYLIDVPTEYLNHLLDHLGSPPREGVAVNRFEVNHRRSQLPLMPSKSLHEHFIYCQDMLQRMGALLPAWREMPLSSASPGSDRAKLVG
jgi:radical SAM superfamily enzyme YgiQ (UPF0313 family)